MRNAARRFAFGLFVLGLPALALPAWSLQTGATRSTSIALSRGGTALYVVNRDAASVTLFRVTGSGLEKRFEIGVGRDPTCVAVRRATEAFVTNAADGTVSVISGSSVKATIPVGAEPRACALTPDGASLYVANQTEGTLSVIDTNSLTVTDTIPVGGRPGALAITGDRVFVTQFFARLISGGPGEGFDEGKEGVVLSFPIGSPGSISETTLSPLADSGFTANRVNLCQQFNAMAPNNTFCPDTTILDPADPAIAADPQGVFPNQLASALVCGERLYLPSIGAQPEPPVLFNVNVQALVHVVDTAALAEIAGATTNLNNQIKTEATPANQAGTLQRAFGNDLVAIDADAQCQNFFVVSRGGNYVLKAGLDANGALDIGAPDDVVRFQTGNIPSGIAVDPRGGRAFVNNEVNLSVSVLDLASGTVVARDVSSSDPPAPGTFTHSVQLGKLVFFTALGVPDNGLVGTELRDIDAVQFRGKQSADAWSSCGSCHPDGLADGVTWIFADGPRQAIPMDGLYSKLNGAHDIRINNWSAARSSVTDFNNNSRNVQCGTGFAGGATNTAIGCPPFGSGAPNPNVFDHGISQGASEALDFETTWTQTIRAPQMPKADPAVLQAGAGVFQTNCASCHGGAKWTKSEVLYLNDPAFNRAFAAGGTPRDPGVTNDNVQIVSYADGTVDPNVLNLLEDVGTFDAASPIEIRQNGNPPFGALGFNAPSLLGVGYHAPYFHTGSAQTLPDVFALHELPAGGTIASNLGPGDQANLLAFLGSLDGRTAIFRSETDSFKEPLP
jgi:YVTN family beta-propeller protein